jgi:Putative auto-transporter adhesin, head GIN domain
MRRLALLLPLALLIGCGGGPKVTQTRDVGTYTDLVVSSGINVDVGPGSSHEVVVSGGKDVIDRVLTEVRDGALRISIKDHGIVIGNDPFDDVHVRVPAAALDTIHVSGTGNVDLGRLERDTLTIDIEGTSDITAAGTVGALTLDISGTGDAELADLEARTARVSVEGAGDAEVSVRDQLDVDISGVGDVTYHGRPVIRQRVEGAGEVRQDD